MFVNSGHASPTMADDKLDRLTELVTELTEKLDTGLKSMETKLTDMNKKIASVETNVDQKIDGLRDSVNADIRGLREEIKKEVKDRVDDEVGGVKGEIQQLREKLEETEKEMNRLKCIVDVPFPPEQSLVLYGVPEYENETEYDTVSWLFKEVLEVPVTIVAAMRIKSKDSERLGVIKVQLETTAQKIDILRAKKRCEENEDAEDITIRPCESHDVRVGRLNAKFLLSKLPAGKDYYITGHGLIRKKDGSTKDGGSRDANDDAEVDDPGGEGAPAAVGNNTVARDDPVVNNNDKTQTEGGNDRKKPDGARSEPKQLPPAGRGQPKKDGRQD